MSKIGTGITRRQALGRLGALGLAPAALLGGLPATLLGESGGRRERLPNILLILSDDHAREDLGCYGSRVARTPNIDRLARQGLRFTQAFAASPMCVPSRSTIYTGLGPVRHGAYPNHSRIYPDTRTLPLYLRELGYRVGLAGKLHVFPRPAFPFEELDTGLNGTALHTDQEKLSRAMIEVGGRFMDETGDQPFCLIVATGDPHAPWDPVDDDGSALELPPYLIDTPATRRAAAAYHAEVERLDGVVGAFDAMLRERGLTESTVTIYASDHGPQWPRAKWNLYDAGIAVPFVARWPGRIAAGATTDAMIELTDVLPTFMELAGGRAPASLDGRSFLPVLLGHAREHRDAVFANSSRDLDWNVYPMRSVRTSTHKLIRNLAPERDYTSHVTKEASQDPLQTAYWRSWLERARTDADAARLVDGFLRRPAEELYDLRTDPYELHNVAAEPANRVLLASLGARLDAWMREQGDRGLETEAESHTRELRWQRRNRRS